jgi:hypothetical protein
VTDWQIHGIGAHVLEGLTETAENVAAGDRDRTGDIQLGKLTLPSASRSTAFISTIYVNKPFLLNNMEPLTKVHIDCGVFHILSHFSVGFGQ